MHWKDWRWVNHHIKDANCSCWLNHHIFKLFQWQMLQKWIKVVLLITQCERSSGNLNIDSWKYNGGRSEPWYSGWGIHFVYVLKWLKLHSYTCYNMTCCVFIHYESLWNVRRRLSNQTRLKLHAVRVECQWYYQNVMVAHLWKQNGG